MVQKSNRRSITRRPPPRVARYDARRDGILRAAARIFRERGFTDTGMRDIAVATDLSPARTKSSSIARTARWTAC
jgi:AcrR family transcriptional regulator